MVSGGDVSMVRFLLKMSYLRYLSQQVVEQVLDWLRLAGLQMHKIILLSEISALAQITIR